MEEELWAAIAAHREWKMKLLHAIDNGTSSLDPTFIRPDNNCDFGKWIYDFTPSIAETSFYNEVKALHQQFHKAAANVVELAVVGNNEEAKKSVNSGSYHDSSSRLVEALTKWLNSNTSKNS
ncbi:MAG: CZB domain-containing protein [Nanoarchaeota archaeon]